MSPPAPQRGSGRIDGTPGAGPECGASSGPRQRGHHSRRRSRTFHRVPHWEHTWIIGNQGRGARNAGPFPRPPFNPCVRLSGSKSSARTSMREATLVTFLKTTLRSRTVGIPDSGFDLGSARHLSEHRPAHRRRGLSPDPHTPLSPTVCLPPSREDQDTSQVMGDGRWVVHSGAPIGTGLPPASLIQLLRRTIGPA